MDAWLRYDASALGPLRGVRAHAEDDRADLWALRDPAARGSHRQLQDRPLLWPVSERWPDDGEINMPEGDLDGSPLPPHALRAPQGGQDYFSTKVDHTAWHVYETLGLRGGWSFR